jgi:hypothetical protein
MSPSGVLESSQGGVVGVLKSERSSNATTYMDECSKSCFLSLKLIVVKDAPTQLSMDFSSNRKRSMKPLSTANKRLITNSTILKGK